MAYTVSRMRHLRRIVGVWQEIGYEEGKYPYTVCQLHCGHIESVPGSRTVGELATCRTCRAEYEDNREW